MGALPNGTGLPGTPHTPKAPTRNACERLVLCTAQHGPFWACTELSSTVSIHLPGVCVCVCVCVCACVRVCVPAAPRLPLTDNYECNPAPHLHDAVGVHAVQPHHQHVGVVEAARARVRSQTLQARVSGAGGERQSRACSSVAMQALNTAI